MEDIEDMAAPDDTARRTDLGVARKLTRSAGRAPSGSAAAAAAAAAGDVPGAQAVYVKTYGCSHNSSDSEYMCGLLQQYGYRLVPEAERENADLWLINSCTVKNPSEEHMATDLKRGRALGKALVVAGCVSQAQPDLAPIADLSIVGVQQLDRVVEVVQETLRGHTMRLMSRAARPALDLPKVRRNPLIEILPVNTGCLGSCTYCKTVYARGKLGSYDLPALCARVDQAFAEGAVEIWLTSEDTGAYGRDIGLSMPQLLEALLSRIPYGRMLRVGMTNPPYMLQHIDDICRLLNHPRCYAFLHVPVQSGSDNVLGAMRREYTRAEFCAVADALHASVPQMTLATDVICGFPGETEVDHDATLNLISKYRFPVLNISQFYPRQGTPAAKMPRVPTNVVKARTREASALFASYDTMRPLLRAEHDVLVTELARDGSSLVAHTKGYVQVLLPHVPEHMGCLLRVRIVETAKFYVRGEVLAVLAEAPSRASAAAVFERAAQLAPKPKAAKPVAADCGQGCNEDTNGACAGCDDGCDCTAPPKQVIKAATSECGGCGEGCDCVETPNPAAKEVAVDSRECDVDQPPQHSAVDQVAAVPEQESALPSENIALHDSHMEKQSELPILRGRWMRAAQLAAAGAALLFALSSLQRALRTRHV